MPSSDERERWNQKYREGLHALSEPDPFLVEAFSQYVHPAFPGGGRALDLAGGAGRHALYLAERGWRVTLTDISEVAIEKARQNAGALASHIHFVVDDLTQFRASQTQFDLVMGFFYLERGIFPEIVQAVLPGGLLVYKTYTAKQRTLEGGPRDPAHLLEPGELLRLVDGLQVLHYLETVAPKATAEVVAKKAC
jgi:SAM-dependent methyltransferase